MGSRLSSRESQPSEHTGSTSTATQTADTTEHYALLGLGRGVDITNHSRWLERTSFQVRHLTREGLVETDNGRHLTAHSEEVESKVTLDAELKAGVKSSNLPATVNIASEYTRSHLSKKYIVGTKISNRTISFVQDFGDVPHLISTPADLTTEKGPTFPAAWEPHKEGTSSPVETATARDSGNVTSSKVTRSLDKQPNDDLALLTKQVPHQDDDDSFEVKPACSEMSKETFEQRLQQWLTECRKQRKQSVKTGKGHSGNDSEDIDRFVWHFGITHYVSAIELGALSYKVVTEEKYERSSSVGHNASLDALPHGGARVSSKVKPTMISSQKTTKEMMIGRITGKNFVAQSNEAVIGYHILPISSLVKDPQLQNSLKCSTEDYIRKQCSGEVLITCGNNQTILYLAVTDGELAVTSHRDDAVVFTLKALNEQNSRHNFEFSLASTLTTLKQERDKLLQCTSTSQLTRSEPEIPPLEMYLETDLNPLTGNGSNPPKMRMDTNFRKTRLLLKKRINHHIASDTQQWRKGRDPFYISCVHRFCNGYLCVRKIPTGRESSGRQTSQPHGSADVHTTNDSTSPPGSGNTHSSQTVNGSTQTESDSSMEQDTNTYRVCIKSSVHSHCEEGHVFMLFRLQPITAYH